MFKSKKFKLTLSIVILLPGLLIAYSVITIYQARKHTAAVIAELHDPAIMTLNLDDLTPDQLKWLLMVEDPNFYEHKGVDFSTPGAGWTTITQALVKIYYFDHFKPGLAKYKQTLIARFALDPLISKDDQLELFINKIYLGRTPEGQVYGFADAARLYYNKYFKDLTRDEYLSLVAMIIAPNSVNAVAQPDLNRERLRRINRLISGKARPNGWLDVWLEGCE